MRRAERGSERRAAGRAACAVLLALGLGAGLASAAAAQSTPAAPPAPAEAEKPAPVEPFAMGDVALAASNTAARIEQELAKLAEKPDETRIVGQLRDLEREIQRERSALEEALAGDYSHNEIEDLRARWNAASDDLQEPLRVLAARIGASAAFLDELGAAERRWKLTLEGLVADGAPAAVRQNAEQTLATIRQARATAEKRRNSLLARQARVVALRSTVSDSQRKLADAESHVFLLALERNRAPLWQELRNPQHVRLVDLQERAAMSWVAITRYVSHHELVLAGQALALLAFLWLGRNARRGLLRRKPDTPEAELPIALRHVVATAVLLTIAPVPWTYTGAPPEFTRLFTVAVLPVWLLLLRAFLPATLHRTVMGLGAIVLVETLRELVGKVLAASQLLLTLELGFAALGVIWLRRPARISAAAPLLGAGFWLRVLGVWLRLGAVVLPIGALAAAAGYVMLGELLLRAYVGGSYLAGLLMLAAEVAEELTRAWLEGGALDFLHMVQRNREQVLAVLRRVYRLAAALTWVWILARSQGISTSAIEGLGAVLAWKVGFGNLQLSLGGLVAFTLTLWIGWLAGRLVFFVLEQEVFARLQMPRGVPYALATISQYAITTVTFLLALSALGIELEKISILMGALGVGIGFGLQNAVSNFISGLMLLFERPIHVGDRLQLENVTGIVTNIGIRASRLRTIEGADVIVPNSELISTRVTNWTLADRMRLVTIPVGVAYASDLPRALEVLREAASAHPDVLRYPAPEAIFVGFGDSSVNFEVRSFADADNFASVRTGLGLAIAEALAAAGIEIPFPQRDLHLRSAEAPIAVRRDAGDREPEAGR